MYLSPFYFNTKSIYHAVYNLLSRLSSCHHHNHHRSNTATTMLKATATNKKLPFFWLTDWLKALLLWMESNNKQQYHKYSCIHFQRKSKGIRREHEKNKRKSSPDLCQLIFSKHVKRINSSICSRFTNSCACVRVYAVFSLYAFNFG